MMHEIVSQRYDTGEWNVYAARHLMETTGLTTRLRAVKYARAVTASDTLLCIH